MTLAKLIPIALQLSMAIVIFCVALNAHNAADQPGVMAAVLLVLVVSSAVSGPYVNWRHRAQQLPPPDGHSQVM